MLSGTPFCFWFRFSEDTTAQGVLTKIAPMPLSAAGALVPQALVLYVSRTQEVVMLKGGGQAAAVKDPYLDRHQPQSVLCMPIVRHGGEEEYVESRCFEFDLLTEDNVNRRTGHYVRDYRPHLMRRSASETQVGRSRKGRVVDVCRGSHELCVAIRSSKGDAFGCRMGPLKPMQLSPFALCHRHRHP